MKKILVFAAVVMVIVLSSCKTAEDCPKAYSEVVPAELAE